MKIRGVFLATLFVVCLFIALQGVAAAQEKAGFNPSMSLKDNLSANTGKRVSLMISTGESIGDCPARDNPHASNAVSIH